jgi:hypothetical protein
VLNSRYFGDGSGVPDASSRKEDTVKVVV